MLVTRRVLAAQTGQFGSSPSVWQTDNQRKLTGQGCFVQSCPWPAGCRVNDAAELMASSPSQQGSSSSCRDPAYEVWENWREGRVGLLSHREIATALLVPLASTNLQPGAGRKNATENGQKRVFICPPFRWLVPVDPMGKRRWGTDFSFPSRVGIQGAGHQVVGSKRPGVLLAL